jgi:hypothetical protein
MNKPQTAVSLGRYHLSIKSWQLLGEYLPKKTHHGLAKSRVDITCDPFILRLTSRRAFHGMQVPDSETTSEEVLCGMVQRMKSLWVFIGPCASRTFKAIDGHRIFVVFVLIGLWPRIVMNCPQLAISSHLFRFQRVTIYTICDTWRKGKSGIIHKTDMFNTAKDTTLPEQPQSRCHQI